MVGKRPLASPVAENRLKSMLVLAEVAKLEELEIDQQQLAAETGRTVDIITRGMTPKDAKDFQKSGNLWNLMNNIMADMMTQQSMAYLRAVAKGEPWPPETDDEPETEEGEEASESEVPETETSVEAEAGTEEAPEEEAAPEEVAEPETPEEDETPEAEEKPEPEDAEPASETEENGPESE
jgi:outer membrane biosynthesis protein TonB